MSSSQQKLVAQQQDTKLYLCNKGVILKIISKKKNIEIIFVWHKSYCSKIESKKKHYMKTLSIESLEFK